MTIRQKLEALASETNTPCVTITLNTHRTHPDNAQDVILLKNLLKETEARVIEEFGKRPAASLLEKLATIEDEVDVNHNLDSLHIYISNDTREVIKTVWPAEDSGVHISDKFSMRSLIKAYNRSEEYLVLLLAQSAVHLYRATNDGITEEVLNDDFPFPDNTTSTTYSDKGSHAKTQDDMMGEFLNRVDKAVVKMHNETGLNVVIVCTAESYSQFMEVADHPAMYSGHAHIDHNNTTPQHLAEQSWEIVKALQHDRRTDAIVEMKESVTSGLVVTNLQEIYQASIDGRGDLLIVHQDFAQPVKMTGDRTFDLVADASQPDVIDDVASNIAWEVLSKKGRVFFTSQDEIKDLGNIVLKTRY